ncbi:MAG: adenosylcobinamide-GDP ribazoletransferase [Humibacillus sp.]|nr:adenosylcobinamide-GDP ribazoletransferase [Humibacillus sp.]MDN5778544.1 adenosylcobinamide-GDP ribazoletransferase [Humibacillus sp.]
MRDGWRLAFGTLTVIRVAPPRAIDGQVAGVAMLLAPMTAVPALVVWIALAILVLHGLLPAAVAAALALVSTTLLSRAMHLDGLADTADALTASYDRDRALQVMRRGDTGPAGAAALVLTLIVQAAALASLVQSHVGAALVGAALVASRLAPAICSRTGIPAARPEGLGHTVAGSVPTARLVATVTAVGGVAAVGSALVGSTRGLALPAAAAAVAVVLVSCAATAAVVRRAVLRFGGITGDVIGAAIEIALTAGLVTATLAVALISG